ncbi:MAG: spore coat protein CotJB [Ruminococcus sp.]|nr:spore coat protein CotJB [Ruminococcus sp.]MDE7226642.1 spore coat protein CotJB [Ruminococcus sp.]
MNTQELLLNQIMQYDFSLKELELYLDTHPYCRHALDMFDKIRAVREKAVREYNENYSPITALENNSTEHWNWIDEPFPWEV